MSKLYSYVVRYDSGFAPNPFYGFCSLATCKPDIRRTASVGNWVVGSGSKSVGRGGFLVYAMRVTEILTFEEFNNDPRFEAKKPFRQGSRRQSCGDNIYYHDVDGISRLQRDSFHSRDDGSINYAHLNKDTKTDRVLISNDFVYFGGQGPKIPEDLKSGGSTTVIHSGIGYSTFTDQQLIKAFEEWLASLRVEGYQGVPYEWISIRQQTNRR